MGFQFCGHVYCGQGTTERKPCKTVETLCQLQRWNPRDLLGIQGWKRVKRHLWALSANLVTSRISVVLKKAHLTGEKTEAPGSDLPRVPRLWIDYYVRQRQGEGRK